MYSKLSDSTAFHAHCAPVRFASEVMLHDDVVNSVRLAVECLAHCSAECVDGCTECSGVRSCAHVDLLAACNPLHALCSVTHFTVVTHCHYV
jgi:hypothetical protein